MTVLGIAVVVFAAAVMLALSRGVSRRLDVSGEANNLLMISRKGQTVMFSNVEPEEVVRLTEGLSAGGGRAPIVSPELMHVSFVTVETPHGSPRAPVSVRGVGPSAWEVHRQVKIVPGGHLPEEQFELLAGCTAYTKLGVDPAALQPGKTVSFENREWTICGTFTADGALTESELWVAESDLQTVLRRRTHSFVVARFESPDEVRDATRLFSKSGGVERFFKGWPEKEYYRQFAEAMAWVSWLSLFMVAAITAAGALIGVNTMYTAITTRMHELATLRVLGFKRRHIAAAILVESVAISLLGGVVGALAAFAANDVPVKLSQGAFFLTVDVTVVAASAALAGVIGVVGALLPSVKPLRLTIVEALRHE